MKILMKMFVLLLCAYTSLVQAVLYEDVSFPDTVTLVGTNDVLQLNGIGLRTKFFFDIYIGALYTETAVNSRDAVHALTGPKRIMMHIVYGEVSKEKLVSGWNEGFENNNTSERLAALEKNITRFNSMFPTLVEGDVVTLDFIPDKGTVVTIKGENKGLIAGDAFYAALLDIWLGDEPADDDLKESLLGE